MRSHTHRRHPYHACRTYIHSPCRLQEPTQSGADHTNEDIRALLTIGDVNLFKIRGGTPSSSSKVDVAWYWLTKVYFRNPGEKAINSKQFYNAVGGDDVVVVGLAQPAGPGTSAIYATNYLTRFRNKQSVGQLLLNPQNAFKKERDKRTQVISYLTAKEADGHGLPQRLNHECHRHPLLILDRKRQLFDQFLLRRRELAIV